MGKGIFFLATLVSMMLATGMGLINLTPPLSDPHAEQVRSFLTPPEGCAMPCWAGIRPGLTTGDDAIRRLAAHPLVIAASISAREFSSGSTIAWAWIDNAPPFIHNADLRTPPHLWVDNDVTQYILLPTQIPFGDVWEVMGEPQTGTISVRRADTRLELSGLSNTLHTASYFGGQMIFDGTFACPANPLDFWGAPMRLTYYSPRRSQPARQINYPLPERLYQPPCKV